MHARTAVEFHRLRLPYRIQSCTSLIMKHTSWYHGLSFCDLRQSGFVRPSASLLSLFNALGPLTGQREVKDQCRFATWRYIIVRRGCGCRCGLGAEKSFSFLRERVDPRLHTYLADEVRETVLVVDRYVRDCLSGLVNDQIDGIVCTCKNSVYQAIFSRHTPCAWERG